MQLTYQNWEWMPEDEEVEPFQQPVQMKKDTEQLASSQVVITWKLK